MPSLKSPLPGWMIRQPNRSLCHLAPFSPRHSCRPRNLHRPHHHNILQRHRRHIANRFRRLGRAQNAAVRSRSGRFQWATEPFGSGAAPGITSIPSAVSQDPPNRSRSNPTGRETLRPRSRLQPSRPPGHHAEFTFVQPCLNAVSSFGEAKMESSC